LTYYYYYYWYFNVVGQARRPS